MSEYASLLNSAVDDHDAESSGAPPPVMAPLSLVAQPLPIATSSDGSTRRARVWRALSAEATKFGQFSSNRLARRVEAVIVALLVINVLSVMAMSITEVEESAYRHVDLVIEFLWSVRCL